MKTRVICMSIALLALITSCATDELTTPATPTPGQQVTITATLPGSGNDADKPGTRMGYTDNTDPKVGGLLTTWAEGDALNIVPVNSNTEGTAQPFLLDKTSLDASADKSKGTFKGTAPDKGDEYRIYHPTSITTLALFDGFSYAEPMQVQTGNDKRDHLTAYHAMALFTTDYTTIDFSGTGFSQSSCMKFVLTPGVAITPTKITLATADGIGCFYNTNTGSGLTASLSLELKDFGEIAAGTPITAYMMMSCQEVILPETGITVTVDAENGSSYSQTIAIESGTTLKGGKMHTLTAKNMTKVVLPSMTFKVKVTDTNNTFNIPFPASGTTPADMTVTWEEGGKAEKIPAGTTLTSEADDVFNHTYNNADPNGTEYTITITSAQTDATKQQIPEFNFYRNRPNGYNNPLKLISIETPLLNTGATDFKYCFGKCEALTTIPEGLFKYNTAATNFSNCFYYCMALKGIPEKLFASNTKATNFGDCFNSCAALTTIPEALFANNTEVTNFSYCFYYCEALTAILEGLFANNTAATDFSNCFSGCKALTAIPEGLFANNTAATNFSYCFYVCILAKLNAKIFSMDGNTDDNKRFEGKVMDFSNCFAYTGSSLTATDIASSIAPQLWKYATGGKDWTKTDCFQNCNANSSSWDGMDKSTWGTPKQ